MTSCVCRQGWSLGSVQTVQKQGQRSTLLFLKSELDYLHFNFPSSVYMHAKLLQSYPTLCDPMEYSPPGSSICAIHHARILGWVSTPFFRGPSWQGDQTFISCVSCTASRFFTSEPLEHYLFELVFSFLSFFLFFPDIYRGVEFLSHVVVAVWSLSCVWLLTTS